MATYCFAVDRSLGKLAKWLRILGFDTIYESENTSKWFYEHLEPERILLTRTRMIYKQYGAHGPIFIEANDLSEQLKQVIEALAIPSGDLRPFSRCIDCNTRIVEIPKETVFGLVPDYIYEIHDHFNICRQCDRIFWRGSHTERSMEVIRQLF